MSFLPVLKTCHNHPTISESSPQTLHAETLVPFYLHLPKKLSGLFLSTLSPLLSVKHVIHQETPSSPPKFNQQPSTIQFNHTYQPIGFLRPLIVEALVQDNQHMKQIQKQTCWKLFYLENEEGSLPVKVSFEDWINQSEDWLEARSKQLQRIIRGWKENGLFLDQLAGWRNEEYSVYGPKDQTQCSKLAFRIERSAVGLFGVLSFGVHLTAYIKKEGNFFFWVPRRSATKATWPSKLDNTVAGGISSGETAFETIVRECFEEASLEEELVKSNIKSTGLISYTHSSPQGWVQPEIQYTYDLELPSENTIIPRPNDGESEDFKLMSFDQVSEALRSHQFKPNCAGVLVDFFVRHGLISQQNEPNYFLVSTMLKQPSFLPLP